VGNWLKLGIPVIVVAVFSITIISISAEESLIPSWIKTNADWWAKGQISDESFVNGIQWLIENNVMRIN